MAAAGHRQKASDVDQARRWRKLVFDVQTLKCEVSALTVDETRAMAADINARWAALQRQWEASGDLHALLGGLIFFEQQLPEWVFKGVMQKLQQQLNNPHATRFLAVRYAHDVLGKTMDESYDWASDNITANRRRIIVSAARAKAA